jgi:Lar family restriction alleviation protein
MSYGEEYPNPCPFCGDSVSKNDTIHLSIGSQSHSYFKVACCCGATGPKAERKDMAITAWNSRNVAANGSLWNPFRLSKDRPLEALNGVDFRGNLASFSPPTILQILSSENKSGIIEFKHLEKKSAVCLKDGKIVAARGTKEMRLGEILHERRLISPEKLKNALAFAKKYGKRLGEALLSLNYVSQKTLHDIINHQIREAVFDLFLWQEGYFEFRECQVNFDPHEVTEINTMEIILESARRIDDGDFPSG